MITAILFGNRKVKVETKDGKTIKSIFVNNEMVSISDDSCFIFAEFLLKDLAFKTALHNAFVYFEEARLLSEQMELTTAWQA